jgi:hypothetical protein
VSRWAVFDLNGTLIDPACQRPSRAHRVKGAWRRREQVASDRFATHDPLTAYRDGRL